VEFNTGVVYSSDSYIFDYSFDFQNCTFEMIRSSASVGGAITVYPENTNLTVNNCSFLGINLSSSVVSGGYIFIASIPYEIHITNSFFANAKVE
jgi:hypothetical protein